MYALINKHITDLLKFLDRPRDIDPYVDLRVKLHVVDVSSDTAFQATYKKYWQLNAARLSASFCAAYFGLLEERKNTPVPTVEEVARLLFQYPTQGDDRRSLQFSFATKLVHMLDPKKPVYDSLIRHFYFLPSTTSREERLVDLLVSYKFLEDEYERIANTGLLARSIQSFHQRFPVGGALTDEKVIDTLIWGFVRLLKDGAIRDGRIQYT
jgi:hypothetical protein